ncbi:hypothetical protein ACOME3_002277 [Neoechinorhynchus agilis]
MSRNFLLKNCALTQSSNNRDLWNPDPLDDRGAGQMEVDYDNAKEPFIERGMEVGEDPAEVSYECVRYPSYPQKKVVIDDNVFLAPHQRRNLKENCSENKEGVVMTDNVFANPHQVYSRQRGEYETVGLSNNGFSAPDHDLGNLRMGTAFQRLPRLKENFGIRVERENLGTLTINCLIKESYKKFLEPSKLKKQQVSQIKNVVNTKWVVLIFFFGMEGLKSFKGIFEEKKITFDDISRRSTLLMLNPPPDLSKEKFQEIKKVFGVDPIKYLRKNPTMDSYAILVARTQDTINKIKGRNFPFLAYWIEFPSQNKTSIHDFILTQCEKCCQWGHRTWECNNEIKCMFCSENHGKEQCSSNNRLCCPKCGGGHQGFRRVCPVAIRYWKSVNKDTSSGNDWVGFKHNQTSWPEINEDRYLEREVQSLANELQKENGSLKAELRKREGSEVSLESSSDIEEIVITSGNSGKVAQPEKQITKRAEEGDKLGLYENFLYAGDRRTTPD